jgi:protein-S-isoprenylcysteine O-methyltransferase Ste14
MPAMVFALATYALFFATFLYAIGFVGSFAVPRCLDGPGTFSLLQALPADTALLALFALQHSIMARPWFKRAWTRVVPAHAERSIYVALSSLALIAIFLGWRPVPRTLWHLRGPGAAAAWTLFGLGWTVVLLSTFMISHADLFGLRQALLHFRMRTYVPPRFQVHWLYKFVRHPIMLGFLVAFWATPSMTVGHLLFATGTTLYILVALRFEEHDLAAAIGTPYREYREQVPMLLPFLKP